MKKELAYLHARLNFDREFPNVAQLEPFLLDAEPDEAKLLKLAGAEKGTMFAVLLQPGNARNSS